MLINIREIFSIVNRVAFKWRGLGHWPSYTIYYETLTSCSYFVYPLNLSPAYSNKKLLSYACRTNAIGLNIHSLDFLQHLIAIKYAHHTHFYN